MPTRAQLERLATEADRDAAAWEARAAAAREQARELRRLAAMVDRSVLQGTERRSIIGSKMVLETTPTTKKLRIAAGRTKRDHAAKRAFLEHGKTDSDIAAEAGVSRATVSAWMAEGDGLRSIPRALAERFRKRYGVPLTAWAKIAD